MRPELNRLNFNRTRHTAISAHGDGSAQKPTIAFSVSTEG